MFACGSSKTAVKQDAPEDINELKARVDDLNNRIYVLTEQLESLRAKPVTVATIAPTSAPAPTVKAIPVSITSKNTYSAQEKEYSSAYELFKEGKYAKALIAFSTFADKYPSSALTDNAIYWIGESYYKQKEYALAIEEYSKILKKFPKESKAPYSMYKIALCYKMLGETKDSETYVNELLSRYPNSEAAKEATNNAELKK